MQYSVLNIKETVGDFRIDAEAYLPKFLNIEKILGEMEHTTIKKEVKVFAKGIFDIKAECYLEREGIPFIRIGDLGDVLLNDSYVRIPELENEKNKKTFLKRGDLVLSKTAYAAASLVSIDFCNVSQDIIAVKLKDNSLVNSRYLAIFLNCRYGFLQMQRWFSGNIQSHLNLSDSSTIKIPILDNSFQILIEKYVEQALELKRKCAELYFNAEQVLLSELGFVDWKPRHQLSFVKNFSDTKAADRMDAEYLQPMYDEFVNVIKSYKNGWDILGNYFNQNKKGFKLIPDKMYQYVEISCVRTSDGDIEPLKLYGNELPPNAKINLFKDDIIVSKVRPYRGAIGIINSDNYVGSSAFTVLQSLGSIKKEVLVALLRIKPYLQLSLKFNTGTSYPTITDNDVLTLPIPLIPADIQKKVEQKISEMYKAKSASKKLLDIAKRGVEMAIEQNEEEAIRWLNEEVESRCQITM